MKNKKQIRNDFKVAVFKRDGGCRVCGKLISINFNEFDAHHITDRNEMPNGGYVLENGITVCKIDCHFQVELFHITEGEEWNENLHPDDLYKLIGSSKELAIKKSNKL